MLVSKEGNAHLRLTSDSLSTLPKRDPDRFLLEYIGAQRKIFRSYASDFHKTSSDTRKETARKPNLKPPPFDQSTAKVVVDRQCLEFGTPVLTARTLVVDAAATTRQVLRPAEGLTKATTGDSYHDRNASTHSLKGPSENAYLVDTRRRKLIASGNDSGFSYSKEDSKKRTNTTTQSHSSDREQAIRLEERRQRKRSKKTIMSPCALEQNDRVRSSRGKVPARQTDLALLHGFSAANVGKHRLTLNPIRSVGVFKKGKASRRVTGKKDAQAFLFSEANFLQSRSASPLPRAFSLSSNHSSLSASSFPTSRSSRTKALEAPKMSNKDIEPIKHHSIQTPYRAEDSIIWDIEDEIVLESGSKSIQDRATISANLPSELNENERSESYDGRRAFRIDMLGGCSADRKLCTSSKSQTSIFGVSPPTSLAPSQSASRQGRQAFVHKDNHSTVSLPKKTSKYFKFISDQPLESSPPVQDVIQSLEHPHDLSTEHSGFVTQCSSDVDHERPSFGLDPWSVSPDMSSCSTSFERHAVDPACYRRQIFSELEDSPPYILDGQYITCGNAFDYIPDELVQSKIPENDRIDVKSVLTDGEDDFSGFEFESIDCFFPNDFDQTGCATLIEEDTTCSYDSEFFANGVVQELQSCLSVPFGQLLNAEESWCADTQSRESTAEKDDWSDRLGFYQGSCLLRGLNLDCERNLSLVFQRLPNVEAEVATSLHRSHWLPQRL